MKLPKSLGLICLVVVLTACDWQPSNSNDKASKPGQTSVETIGNSEDRDFPESWVGEWKGELSIYRGNKVIQSVGVEMTIKPKEDGSVFEWTTRYLDEKKTTKPYQLQVVDKDVGHYQIDEGPIQLDSYFGNGTLRGWFQTGGILIYSQYEMVDDNLVFELISGKIDSKSDGTDPESGVEVEALPINAFQRMVLKRTTD